MPMKRECYSPQKQFFRGKQPPIYINVHLAVAFNLIKGIQKSVPAKVYQQNYLFFNSPIT